MYNVYNCPFQEKLKDLLDELKSNGRSVVIVSDPPFNIKYHYGSYKDNLKYNEYLSMINDAFYSNDVPFVIIHYPEYLYRFSVEFGIAPDRVVSWVYNSNTPRQHRDIAFYKVMPDFNKVKQPYKNLNDKRIKQRIAEGKTGCKIYDWWNINQVKNVSKDKTSHPCQMPLEVMKNIIGILPDNAIIIDPFMGSGTTGVASLQLNHDFYGFEIDKEYFDIAKKRIEMELVDV